MPPTDALRPINPDNARGSRFTAAAGTWLASSYSWSTVIPLKWDSSSIKALYTPKGFFEHAVSLGQAFAHCPIFSTAASRRSLARVAVLVLGNTLSCPLPVIALVSHYLTNKLIGRRSIPKRLQSFLYPPPLLRQGNYQELAPLSRDYTCLWGSLSTCY